MNNKLKVSSLGLRIGYLYDIASQEDRESIDKILEKYSEEYPLIFVGSKMELAASPAEAKHFRSVLNNFKK